MALTNPKLLREKVQGYIRFREIVKAIKMVALSQLKGLDKKLKTRHLSLSVVQYLFHRIKSDCNTYAVIPMTTERSCCGTINTNNMSESIEQIETLRKSKQIVRVCTMGERGRGFFYRHFRSGLSMNFKHIDKEEFTLLLIIYICERLMSKGFDKIYFFFSRFLSVVHQQPTSYELYSYDIFSENIVNKWNDNYAFFYNSLLNKYHNDEFFLKRLYDFSFSPIVLDRFEEHSYSALGARANAMDSASKNADNLIASLTLQYNKARQEYITNELIEIVSRANFVD